MNTTLAAFLYTQGLIEDNESFFVNATTITDQLDECLSYLYTKLNEEVTESSTEEEIQYWFYEAGKIHFADNLRFWFQVLYSLILKEPSGSRFGFLTMTLGVDHILNLIYNVREGNILPNWGWIE